MHQVERARLPVQASEVVPLLVQDAQQLAAVHPLREAEQDVRHQLLQLRGW